MRLISFFIVSLFLLSCTDKSTEAPTYEDATIEIETLTTDTVSVRALDYKNDAFWFAGSRGTYGKIIDSSKVLHKGKVVYNGSERLEFRSIAVTEEFTFILTAGDPGLIYRISHTNDSLELVYEEFGEKVFYDSLEFWNETDGIAMGDPQDDCFTILMTEDAGESWNKINCDTLPKIMEGEAAYAASNSNIALYEDHIWIATGGQAARVWHSADRGKTWETQETPIISGGMMTGIYAIDFYDENLGVIIGGDWDLKTQNVSNKAITRDGGKSWQLLSDGTDPGYCSDISFIPESDGKELLAVGSPGIWWSGNQGAEWKQLSNDGYYTVSFSNNTEGVLAGNNKISSFRLLKK